MKKSFLIYLVALLLVTGVLGYAVWSQQKEKVVTNINSTESGWKTYTNEEFGYSIQYPNSLVYREYSDLKTGAAFRPVGSDDEYENEVISVSASFRASNEELQDLTFEEYVQSACPYEVQDYTDLYSQEEITSNSGLTGYLIRCKIDENNDLDISQYQARFENNIQYTYPETGLTQDYNIVDINLLNQEYEDIFRQMLKTFDLNLSQDIFTDTAPDCDPEKTYTDEYPPESEWLTYTNEKYGFSFKYPESYELNEIGNDESVVSTNSPGRIMYFTASVADPMSCVNPYSRFIVSVSARTVEDILDELYKESYPPTEKATIIDVDGHQAYESNFSVYRDILIDHLGKTYWFTCVETTPIFEKILATFKFLD